MKSKTDRFMLAAVLAAVSLTALGCGATDSTTADEPTPTQSECPSPPMDRWERTAALVPAAERAASPEAAVSAIAVATTIEITSVSPGEEADVTDVDVLGDGAEGTYHVRQIDGQWLVVGGEGCGAQIASTSTETDDCEFPTDIPTASGESFLVECGPVEP